MAGRSPYAPANVAGNAYDDDAYVPGMYAGAPETIYDSLPWYYGQMGWISLALLVVGAVGLIVGAIALDDVLSHNESAHISAVCNRGSNSGDGLSALCDDVLGVPGLNLLSGDAGSPGLAFVRRISKGVGVNATSFIDYLEIGALIESETPALVVGVGPAPDEAVTLELDLSGLNTSSVGSDGCGVAGNGTAADVLALARRAAQGAPSAAGSEPTEGFVRDKIIAESDCTAASNLWLELPHTGFSLCVGEGHVCPNDGTIDRCSILGGTSNTLNTSDFSVIGGGTGNSIINCIGSVVVGGDGNSITASSFSGIGGGEGNTIVNVTSSDAYIAGGFGNTIGPGGDDSFIGGGQDNVNRGTESAIGAGDTNIIEEGASRGGIFVGSSNTVASATSNCVIMGGSSNSINDTSNAAILAGSGVSLSGPDNDDTAATEHLLVTSSVKTTGYVNISATPYVVSKTDYILTVDSTALGPVNITLPDGLPDGMNVVVKDIGAASGDTITVYTVTETMCPSGGACAAPGSDTITTDGGSATFVRTTLGWMAL